MVKFLLVLFFCVASAGQTSRPAQQVVRTEEIQIADKTGKVKITMGCGPNGEASIVLRSNNGDARMQLSLLDNRDPIIILYGPRQIQAMTLVVSQSESICGLAIRDNNDKMRLRLGLEKWTNPGIFLSHYNEVPAISLTSTTDATGIGIFEKTRKPKIALMAVKEGAALVLHNEEATTALQLDRNGNTSFRFTDLNGRVRFGLYPREYGEYEMGILDSGSEVIWHAP